MRVHVSPGAAREVRALPPQTKARMKRALRRLAEDPYGKKGPLDVKRLRSSTIPEPVYRLREGGWRAVYLVRGRRIEVVRVFPRDEGYGWMERMGFL